MARDYGHEVKIALETNSVSGRGMSPRVGARGHMVVVGARSFNKRETTIRDNPRNQQWNRPCDEFLDGTKIQCTVQPKKLPLHGSRLQLALKAALDGLSWVDTNKQRTETQAGKEWSGT